MTEPDRWADRRAARRAAAPAEPAEPAADPLVRPPQLRRAFVLWLVVGVPAVPALTGIVVIAAALNLRAGFRGARIMLTVLAFPSVLVPAGVVAAIDELGSAGLLALVAVPAAAVVLTATVLMWHPNVTRHFQAVRRAVSRPT